MMNIKELILLNRSYRRFDENILISKKTLGNLVNLARISASARNQQSLKYYLSNNKLINSIIFKKLSWASFLKDWTGPIKGERPSSYIIVLNDTHIATNHFCDEGIAAQSILLGAVEQKLGGCILGSINRTKLHKELNLDKNLEILLVIAIGKPIEKVIIEDIKNNDYKYWRNQDNIHHVPKRGLNEVIIS